MTRTPSHNAAAKPKKGVDIKCYECEGRGHLARECRTRLRRETNSRAQRDSRNPSERSKLNPGYPHENRRASSFFLSASQTAAGFHTSLRLRQGKPTVRVKIRGVNREFGIRRVPNKTGNMPRSS